MLKPADLPPRRLEKYYSIADACEKTSLSKTTLKEALRERRLGFVKLGAAKRSRVLIPESELLRWLETQGTYFPSADVAGRAVRS